MKYKKHLIPLLILICTIPFLYTLPVHAAGIIFYVDVDATGSNIGSSWANAFPTLQDALKAASNAPPYLPVEIWVAAGTYYPDEGSDQTNNARASTFQLINGVSLYGGFAGTETAREQRDWVANTTILSGDIDGNDTNSDGNDISETSSDIQGSNAYHVVTGSNTNDTAGLDGFTITAGQANRGRPNNVGGGMYNSDSSPTITNATFSGNSASAGGGMYNYNSSPTITNATFSGNTTIGIGGGMYNYISSPTITNATFSGNSANNVGGGMHNISSSPTITNATFSGNSANYNGGGMSNTYNSRPTITNATFSGNSANYDGGGMYNSDSSLTITNSILWGNGTSSIYNGGRPNPTISYSLVEGGYGGSGNIDVDPLFIDADGADDIPGTADDDLRLQDTSPAIDAGNNAAVPAGITTDLDGNPRFVDIPWVVDSGITTAPIVDMGAYETRNLRLYVDKDAVSDANDGSSWENAFIDLQSALAVADSGNEIWVAAGAYYPDEGSGQTDNARESTFQLINGVSIYGGFAGTETTLEQRDWTANTTILSGDIDGNDTNSDGNDISETSSDIQGSNAYHVVTGSNTDGTASLDGFTITAGQANGGWPYSGGGGMFNLPGSPTLTNVTFSGNAANDDGGGMFNDVSSPTLTNVIFSGNTAGNYGGGMRNGNESNPAITNATFSNNMANRNGGGMYNYSSSPILTNATFSGNAATSSGGGMYNSASNPTITNSILWGNGTSSIHNESSSNPTISYSLVEGGYTGSGNINVDPLFIDADGADDIPGTADDDLRLQNTSPAIDAGNNGAVPAGITTDLDGNPRFIDHPWVVDSGITTAPIVDMGAYETRILRLYVDKDAVSGANNGSSWENAFIDLQSALAVADSDNEIWVAAGAYYPDEGSGQTDNARESTFQLINGVSLYGGFAGTETALDQRDWVANITILSGDIDGNDTNSDGNNISETSSDILGSNAYHVVTGSNTDGTALFDGFTITAGQANGGWPYSGGGGMFNLPGSPTIINTTFSGNSANDDGGGMFNDVSSPTLTNVIFSGNTAGNYGGGMRNGNESNPAITNATFSGNSANIGGGMYNDNSSPTLTNATFSGNTATYNGGGMFNYNNSSPTITNGILWGNGGSSIYNDGSSNPTISYSLVEGGYGGSGNINVDPLFIDADGPDDIPGTADDDLRLQNTSPAIDAGNNGAVPAGITTDLDGNPRFIDHPWVVDSGITTAPIVDMGAYEKESPRIFVDKDAVLGANNGSSWENAFVDLQSALAVADSGNEIWVAAGAYYPDEGSGQTDNARESTFQLINGVSLYGGFAGTETTLDQRDWTANTTILSGDIDGNDTNSDGNNISETSSDIQGSNAYHVVTGSNTDGTANLDGFTITAGQANGSWSYSYSVGGGMYNFANGSPTLTNATFSGNMSNRDGGGMFNRVNSSPSLTNVIFSGNTANYDGGGMANIYNSSPTLTNATFSGNAATNNGGGMFNYNNSSPTLTNATFSGNMANRNGGGMFNYSSSPTLTNATFSGNSANNGGGMYNFANGSPTLTNGILWGNGTSSMHNESSSNPTISYSLVEGGYGGSGNINVDPLFVDADGADDIPGTADDDLRLQNTSPAIDAGNNGAVPAGITTDLDGNARFVDIPWIVDSGITTAPIVDMGAYETRNLRLYVDKDAVSGANDGSSWENAFVDLQSALAVADSGNEIWVAAGAYYPDEGSGQTDNARESTFQLINGVSLYGGFAGTETTLEQRDWVANTTILSGDIDGNDTNSDGNNISETSSDIQGSNAYHVVTGSNTDDTTNFDGFTITAGQANGGSPDHSGGGMYNTSGSPTITNATFSGNSANNDGGGMYNTSSSPTITNVTFSGNSANDDGGGMVNSNSSPTITNATFSGNAATELGGGMYNSDSSSTITNATFSGNAALYGGGMLNYASSPTITNATFSGNAATELGGGMYNYHNSSPSITNGILWGNGTSSIYNDGSSNPTISYSLVEGGYVGSGNINVDPLFIDADGADDIPGTADDDLRLQNTSPAIDAGNNGAVPAGITTDLDGNSRFVEIPWVVDSGITSAPIVDMGAYEFQVSGGPTGTGPGGVGTHSGTSSLMLWLQANSGTGQSSDGAAISTWADASGYDHHVAQSSGSSQPSFKNDAGSLLNEQPIVHFDGDDLLDGGETTLNITNDHTIFVVKKDILQSNRSYVSIEGPHTAGANGLNVYRDSTDDKYIVQASGSWATDYLSVGNISNGVANVATYQRLGSNQTFSRNGGSGIVDAGSAGPITFAADARLRVGASSSANSNLTGDIAELIIFSSAINSAQRTLVQNYLSAKYNIPLDTSNGAKDVYTGDDIGFDVEVAGIGQEDDGSNDIAYTSGLVVQNDTFLTDSGDYLLFGHNGSANENVFDSLPAGIEQRWQREWACTKTDVGNNGGTITLIFDFSDGNMDSDPAKMPNGDANNYRLLKRDVVTDDFTDVTASSGATVSFEGDRIIFSNVETTGLCSNLTLGTVDADASPTAVSLQSLGVNQPSELHIVLATIIIMFMTVATLIIMRRQPSTRS